MTEQIRFNTSSLVNNLKGKIKKRLKLKQLEKFLSVKQDQFDAKERFNQVHLKFEELFALFENGIPPAMV